MREKIKALLAEMRLAIDYALLGSMPPEKQSVVVNPTVSSLSSAAAEFLIGFSLLFMLMNGVFTEYFVLSSSLFSISIKVLLFVLVAEGLYRTFSITLGKRQSAGSVFYTMLVILYAAVSKIFSFVRKSLPSNPFRKKLDQKTLEEKKQKEIADNFKKFIEYGMDNPSLTWERQ
ncbi:MAG: hypothetical protein HY051_04945 [Candidatus Aenigmarchaeota archaeon]|nr:hypothetical protein [Candidatus Aenigmarchaeota archaeon]